MSIENQKTIEHSKGGSTTKDATDLGVPMLPADPSTPKRIGPEDALGDEPTRGDYSNRLGGVNSHQSKLVDPDAGTGEQIGKVEKQGAPRISD